jgi:hypothetical protein
VAPALEAVLGIVALLALLVGILGALSAFLGDEIDTEVRVDATAPVAEVEGYELEAATATLTIDDPDLVDRLAVAAPTVAGALVVGIVVTLVLRVVSSLRQGDPFTRANARTLGRAAVVAVVGGVVVAGAEVAADVVLRSDLPDELPVAFSAAPSSVSLFAGLILAALAQVFHQGTLLREDLEGVV